MSGWDVQVRSVADFPLQPAKGKGHVPEENLERYRRLRELAFLLSRSGNMLSGIGEYDSANKLWEIAGKIKRKANDLRVDLPTEKEETDGNGN